MIGEITRRTPPLVRFAGTGAISFAMILTVTGIATAGGAMPALAYGIALVAAFVLNYFLNRHLVFEANAGCPKRQAGLFLTTSLVMRGAEWLGFVAVTAALAMPTMATAFVVQATSFLIKFHLLKHAVFRPESR